MLIRTPLSRRANRTRPAALVLAAAFAVCAMSAVHATEHMTVRDLLTHRSGLGLGEGDLLITPNTRYPARYRRGRNARRNAGARQRGSTCGSGVLDSALAGITRE